MSSRPSGSMLSGLVNRYLIFEGEMPEGQTFIQSIIPTRTEFITFNLNGTPQYFYKSGVTSVLDDCVVSGLLTTPFEGHLKGCVKLIGIQLNPSSLWRLFGVPASYLVNMNVTLRELMGVYADVLCARLMETTTLREAIDLIEKFLVRCLTQNGDASTSRLTAHAIGQVGMSRGAISVRSMANEYRVSERWLQKTFMSQLGVTPKVYIRLHRFSEVIWSFNNHKRLMGDLIYALGYYDQAHFIKEFRKFSGENPGTYFKLHPGWNQFFTTLDKE